MKPLLGLSLMIALISPSFGANRLERNKQVLKDFCTLNLYLSGLYGHADEAAFSTMGLLGQDNVLYPADSDPFFSYLENVEYLAGLYLGKTYIEGFSKTYSGLLNIAQNEDSVSAKLCDVERVAGPGWLQRNIEVPTADEIEPVLRKKHGSINAKTSDEINAAIEVALADYIKLAVKRNQAFIHELSLKASELVDGHFANGVKIDTYEIDAQTFQAYVAKMDAEAMVKSLEHTKGKAKNPLYWSSVYLVRFSWPNTTRLWKLQAQVNSDLENIYRVGLRHIRRGTFKSWWEGAVTR